MTKFRSIEQMFRGMVKENHAPALKIPEPDRVNDALMVLHVAGIASAVKKDDNTIEVNALEMIPAQNVLNSAVAKGMIQAKPLIVSAEAMEVKDVVPEPHPIKPDPTPPEGGTKIGEEAVSQKEPDLKIGNEEQRILHMRRENKVKKIDEEQIDEVSKTTLKSYVKKAEVDKLKHDMDGNFGSVDKRYARENGIASARQKIKEDRLVAFNRAFKRLNGNEQIDELSKGTLKSYATKAFKDADKKELAGDSNKAFKRNLGVAKAVSKYFKEEQIDEGKKDDAAKAESDLAASKKHFAKHPRADKLHQDIITAARHHNYVQDASDFIYSNNSKHVKYEDWDKMKPHIENELKAHGLE